MNMMSAKVILDTDIVDASMNVISSTDIVNVITKLGIPVGGVLKAQIDCLGNTVISKVEWELTPPNPRNSFGGVLGARLTIEFIQAYEPGDDSVKAQGWK